MESASPLSISPQTLRLWQWGTRMLWVSFVLALALILYLAWHAQEYVGFFVLLPILAFATPILLKRPDAFLYLALAGFVIITNREEGIQPLEVVYGLLFIGFLAYWYIRQVFLKEEAFAVSSTGWALGFFLTYVVVSATWGMMFGARLSTIIGEMLVLIMMAFFFPITTLIRKHPEKTKYLLLILCWIGLYVSIRNIQEYRADLSNAERLYQVLSGRVALNEVLLMMPALGALTFLLYARTWTSRIVIGGLFIIFFVSLIVTQSRGYWMAFALGAGALFLLTDIRRKVNIMLLFGSGIAGFIFIGFLLFPQYAPLVIKGMAERLSSLGTAFTSDISLVNRFYESKAVWGYIKQNPILGYGIGTPYEYFNIISDHTRHWAFIHNGYLGMWYKYGIIGLGLLLFFWLNSIRIGIRIFKTPHFPRLYRVTALACAVCLIAELLVANTSTPFQSEDPTLMITMLAAIITGLHLNLSASPPIQND